MAAGDGCGCGRRALLGASVGLAVGMIGARPARAATPTDMPPQVGDRFVFASGSKKDQVVRIEDLELGGRQVLAYPIDPASGTIRNGTRLNEVALLRVDPDSMDERTSGNAADGVVAYSAVCTHQGCPVSMWKSSNKTLFCSCHSSQFDPRQGGAVVWGPAPRPLAMLPLDEDDGVIVVAGEFVGDVGFK